MRLTYEDFDLVTLRWARNLYFIMHTQLVLIQIGCRPFCMKQLRNHLGPWTAPVMLAQDFQDTGQLLASLAAYTVGDELQLSMGLAHFPRELKHPGSLKTAL